MTSAPWRMAGLRPGAKNCRHGGGPFVRCRCLERGGFFACASAPDASHCGRGLPAGCSGEAARKCGWPNRSRADARQARPARMSARPNGRCSGADDRVFHDVPAVGTHRVVAVGCGDAGYPDSACDRGDQLGPVGKFERGGGGIGLGVARETARRDVKTCGAGGRR
jgi:hypothetical protein